VKTGDTDEQDEEQVADEGVSSARYGDKRILGRVVQMTKTDWCRRRTV